MQHASTADMAAQTNAPAHAGRMIPLTEWNNFHTWPPIGGLRHLVFNEKTNGFANAFKRVGRRILVDEDEFFKIVRSRNEG